MYRSIVFVHVLSALAFMATHGVSIALCFRIKRARSIEDARPILDLSASMQGAMYAAFAFVGVSGIAAGIFGEWWRNGWFWVSVALLVAMVGIMTPYGANAFNRIRRAAGLPPFRRRAPAAARHPARSPGNASRDRRDAAGHPCHGGTRWHRRSHLADDVQAVLKRGVPRGSQAGVRLEV